MVQADIQEKKGSCAVERQDQETDNETMELLTLIEKYPRVILTLLVRTRDPNKELELKTRTVLITDKLNSVFKLVSVSLSDYRTWFARGKLPWQGEHWACWKFSCVVKESMKLICVPVLGQSCSRHYRGSVWRTWTPGLDRDTLLRVRDINSQKQNKTDSCKHPKKKRHP